MTGGVPDSYQAAAGRVGDDPQYREFETHVRSTHHTIAWISIEPRWARYFDFAERVPAFLFRLDEV